MKLRLRTSAKADQYMEEMQKSLKFTTKAALARIAIGYSLNEKGDPILDDNYKELDTNGFEFQRPTLTGDHDRLYKALVIEKHKAPLSDEEYYPKHVKAHLERGIKLLYSEYKFAGNRDKFFEFLLKVK